MSSELVAFLRARLDEGAARAEAAARDTGSARWYLEPGAHAVLSEHEFDLVAGGSQDHLGPERGDFIAENDPARVFAEVEAKREVIRLTERALDYHETFMNGFGAAMEGSLRLFALSYVDHPDYREEWRP